MRRFEQKTNGKRFLAANSIIIGTVIIGIGFFVMLTDAIIGVAGTGLYIAFFFTISGIAFWWIAYMLNPNQRFSLRGKYSEKDEVNADNSDKNIGNSDKEEINTENSDKEEINTENSDKIKSELPEDNVNQFKNLKD